MQFLDVEAATEPTAIERAVVLSTVLSGALCRAAGTLHVSAATVSLNSPIGYLHGQRAARLAQLELVARPQGIERRIAGP
jgi:hypothetical protein